MAESGVRRPGGVTLVAVLTWITGALDFLAGVVLFLQAGDPELRERFAGQAGVTTIALTSMVLGTIAVIVAVGLWRGNSAARMIITVVQVLSIIGSLFLAIAYIGLPVGEWIGIVLSFIVLMLLWSKKASAFFNS